MRTSTRIAWNTIAIWSGSIVSGLTALVVIPLLVKSLGKAEYGLTGVLVSTIGLSLMLDLGLRQAVTRHLAKFIALDDPHRVNQVLSSGLACYSAIGATFALGFLVLAPWIVDAFKLVPRNDAILLLQTYGSLTVLLSFIGPTYEAVIVGSKRFDISSVTKSGEVIVRGIAIGVLVVWLDCGLYGWAVARLLGQGVRTATNAVMAHRLWPPLSARFSSIRRDTLGELFKLGGWLSVYQIVANLNQRIDPLVITKVLGAQVGLIGTALYLPASALSYAARPFVNAVSIQIFVLATGYHEKGNEAQLSELLLRGTRMTLLLGIPSCVVFGCFADEIIRLWLGPGFGVTAQALVIMAVTDVFRFGGKMTHWNVMLGMNRARLIVVLDTVVAVINTVAGWLLVRWMWQQGWDMASVCGVLVPTAITAGLARALTIVYVARQAQVGVRRFLRESYAAPLAILCAMTAAALLVRQVIEPDSPLRLAICISVPIAVWMPGCWWWAFDDQDRNQITHMFRRVRGRLGKQDPTKPRDE